MSKVGMICTQTITPPKKPVIATLEIIGVEDAALPASIQRENPDSFGANPIDNFDFQLPLSFQNTKDQKLIDQVGGSK